MEDNVKNIHMLGKDSPFWYDSVTGRVYKQILSLGSTSEIGSDGRNLFPGDRLFQLRATHGLPIGDAIHQIYSTTSGVDWVSFIEEARRNGWYDFQTIEAIENAFLDCDFDKAFALNVIKRMKYWMLANPLKQWR